MESSDVRVASSVTDEQVHRLLCTIFPSRTERVLDRVATWAYGRSGHGIYGFVGDRADDLRALSVRVRVAWKLKRDTLPAENAGADRG